MERKNEIKLIDTRPPMRKVGNGVCALNEPGWLAREVVAYCPPAMTRSVALGRKR
jgi:hypothetical protein